MRWVQIDRPGGARRTRRVTAVLAAALVLGPLGSVPATAAAGVPVVAQQLPGTDGCVSEDGSDVGVAGACADGVALVNPRGVTASRDGRNVYVAAQNSESIVVLARGTSGALAQLPGTAGCVSRSGTGGLCATARALKSPRAVAISPDGANAYATGGTFGSSDAVAIFARDPATGALHQLDGQAGCIVNPVAPGVEPPLGCAPLPTTPVRREFSGVYDVAVSPDGGQVAVANFHGGSILVFERGGGGALTWAECPEPREDVVSNCHGATVLEGVRSVAYSPDGRHVYTAGGGFFSQLTHAVGVFERQGPELVQVGCVTEDGSYKGDGTACDAARGVRGATDVAVSPDGRHVYVRSSGALAIFARSASTGLLTQLSGVDGCLSTDGVGGLGAAGACTPALGLGPTGLNAVFGSVVVTADGEALVSASTIGHVAVFGRDAVTGRLTQAQPPEGCVGWRPPAGTCVEARGVRSAESVVTSPDSRDVYVTGGGAQAVAAFALTSPAPPPDTEPPVLAVPDAIATPATGPQGATVTYEVTATDDVDPDPIVECAPGSGDTFPVGTTTVTCTATDASGNRATAAFDVVVSPPRDTVVILVEGIDPLPILAAPPTKDPETTMAAAGLFGPLLAQLGCTRPLPAVQETPTVPCDDGVTHWAAYSYAGVDANGVPRRYRGADTHQPLGTSAAHLQDLVAAVRREHGEDVDIVVVGFSLGGTVAARWASDGDVRDVPVVTIASPLYGMWPDSRRTNAAEDVDWYCNPFTSGELAKPFVSDATHQMLCPTWAIDLISLGPLGFARGGYRSAASYDWRTGRVFAGPGQPRDLLLLNAGNRRDMVAPVFWEVDDDAAGLLLAACSEEAGHGCLKAAPSILAAVDRVVDTVRGRASGVDRATVGAAFTAGAPASATAPVQLGGYSVRVRPTSGWRLVAAGERVVTYGPERRDDRTAVTCLVGAEVTREGAGIRVRWPDWRPHSLVLRFRHDVLPLTFQATGRIVPADDAPGNTYELRVRPLPGASKGACAVP